MTRQPSRSGTWSPSRHTRPFVGENYIYSAGGAGQYVDFLIDIKEGGYYQVLAPYTPGPNRTETAVYEIPAANGVQTITVNQQERPKGPFCFQPLGEFSFEAGQVKITVSAEGNKKGVVVADAIQVLTPDEFTAYKEEFEKNSPKLLASLTTKPDPNQPAVKRKKRKSRAAAARSTPQLSPAKRRPRHATI